MNKYLLIVGVVLALFIGMGAFFLLSDDTPKSLEAPIIKSLGEEYSSTVQLSGSAYPEAKVLIFIDGEYVEDAVVDESGSFSKTIKFDSDGSRKITLKQTFKNVSSSESKAYSVSIDVTPPDASQFSLSTETPELTTEKAIILTGTGSLNEFININGKKFEVDANGNYEISYELQEGENELKFSMSDKLNNNTETLDTRKIKVDTVAPKISNFIAPINLAPTEESVVLDIGHWEGYLDSYNSVALTGSVKGDVKSITVDGKQVTWDENNDIYQRMSLFIYGGLNKYKVVVEDMAGNVATGFVQTTSERTKDSIDLNLNEY